MKDGKITDEGIVGYYWSSSTGVAPIGEYSNCISFSNNGVNPPLFRVIGRSIRCIKD
jgi:hypothetical protein